MQSDIAMVTEVLARELAPSLGAARLPRSVGARASWSAIHWQYAEAAATIQGIAPLLWRHRIRMFDQTPARWTAFLQQQAERNGRRIERMLALRDALAGAMRARGLRLLVFKGCDIGGWLYDDPALRPMGDIDVMVDPASFESFDAAARAAGFLPVTGHARHRCYALDGRIEASAPGEAPENPIRLDAHTKFPGIPARFADDFTRLAWDKATERRGGSSRWLGLDNSSLAVHLLVHTAENAVPRSIRFLNLVDLYLLARKGLNWTEVDRLVRTNSLGWRIYPAIALLERYFPGTVPPALVAAARREASLAARLVMRSGIARFSYCSLANLDPGATLTGKGGLAGSAMYALRAMLFDRLEYKDAHSGLSEREVFENHNTRMRRWLAWLFGRPGYRPNAMRMFLGAREISAHENPHGSA